VVAADNGRERVWDRRAEDGTNRNGAPAWGPETATGAATTDQGVERAVRRVAGRGRSEAAGEPDPLTGVPSSASPSVSSVSPSSVSSVSSVSSSVSASLSAPPAAAGATGAAGPEPAARRLPRSLRQLRARTLRARAAQEAEESDGAGASARPGVDAADPAAPPESPAERAERGVPVSLRVSAGWSWRLIAIGAAIYGLMALVGRVRVVVIPVVAGLVIAALINPAANRLRRLGVPRLAAAFIALFGFLAIVAGGAVLVGFNAANEFPTVSDQVSAGVDQVHRYLTNGPFHLSQKEINDTVASIKKALANNRGRLVNGVISGASVAVEVLTGILLTLFSTFFFVYDGAAIWEWVVRRFPDRVEDRVRGAGDEAWHTVTGYVRGTVIIASVDAISIAIGLICVGTPLVAPLAVLTFVGGFIPIVGATVAGVAAVLVTLVAGGLPRALVVLGIVLAVQQIEGHLLQPLVMRRAVRLHPLAIVISLAAGGVLAGIPGAMAAVPFVAVVNRVAGYLARTSGGAAAGTGGTGGTDGTDGTRGTRGTAPAAAKNGAKDGPPPAARNAQLGRGAGEARNQTGVGGG